MASSASHDLGPSVLGVAWSFAIIAICVVIARMYVRLTIVRKLTIDDGIVILTLLLALGNSIFLTISTSWGLGRHIGTLAAEPLRVMYAIKWVYLCEFFSIMSPGFGRISFALLLLAITPPTMWRRRLLWVIIGVQFAVDVGTVAISFSQCRPISGFWDQSLDADCWPPYVQQYTGFAQGSVCSLVDLLLATYPASLFWDLNMQWKQKASLSFIMGLGIFSMIASIVKTVNLRAITETDDLTYAMAKLAIWWTLEAYFVLIAVSIPTIKPILKGPSTSTDGSFSRNSRTGKSHHSHHHHHNSTLNKTWVRAPGRRTVDHNGPFKPLGSGGADDSVALRNFSGDPYGAGSLETAIGLGHHGDETDNKPPNQAALLQEGGIRKDTEFSVTVGRPGGPEEDTDRA
ncbi:integral membrane protein [Xylariaceae sp. FL0804]|nr:integral membrane protein [Xylariaceae sp. FL0804]